MIKRLILSIAVLIAIGLSILTAQDQPLRIFTEEWPPYNYIGENGNLTGFSVEIVQAMIRELNVDINIEYVPNARNELYLDTIPNAMSFSLFRTPSREDKYKWIGPISDEALYFYKRKESTLAVNTLDDAKEVGSISAPHQGLIFSVLEKEGFNNIDKTTIRSAIIEKLIFGRVDLSISYPRLGVIHYLKVAGYPEDIIVQTPVKLVDFPLYIACNKNISDSVIREWQNALDSIKTSGKYDQIYKKYLGESGN